MADGPVSDVVGGLGEVVKMGATNPRMRSAGQNLAFSLEVVTGLIRTALLPLAVVNARAQDYFAKKFPEQLADHLADVPPEAISSPQPSVAGPVMQGLNYSHEEPALRDLYLGLLATSMDSRRADEAHPGFAAIISALSAQEVQALQVLFNAQNIMLAEVRRKVEGSPGFVTVARHLSPWASKEGAPIINPMLPAFIDNWSRLGLATLDYGRYVAGEGAYDWVDKRPEYKALEAALPQGATLNVKKGLLELTSFGAAFASAVGAPGAEGAA